MDSLYENIYKKRKTDYTGSKWTTRKERMMCSLWVKEPVLYESKKRNPEKRKEIIDEIAKAIGMEGNY